ncbi:antiviral innate immune response receptor RIG-I [Rhinophrynus dorsalis]
MSREVKQSLMLFSRYIEGILRPTYLLGYMSNWLPQVVIEEIQAEEKKGPTTASALFLQKLLELEDEGWYQGFLDGLKAAGYTGLSEALEKSDFSKIESLDEARNLLNTISNTVKNNINPKEFICHFNGCLLQREIEEIVQEINLKGDIAGAEKLIDCLLRSDKKEWPKVFTLAMEREECTEVLALWSSDKECDSKPWKSADEQEEETSAFNMFQYSEEPEMENQCLPAPPSVLDNQEKTDISKMDSYFPDSVPTLTLRSYQTELAQPAYSGMNTIICAPTGSGKTIVSLAVCEQHLKSMPSGKKGKIVFMTTKVPVYEQQRDVFCKYFKDSGYSVVGFSGETTEYLPIGLIIYQSDIIILTPQILVNCLENKTVPSISIFSMMIFDECHNTIGYHPYNVLMFKYLDLKLSMPWQVLPQIIGLTASVGTGKAKSVEEAKHYISKLCASLDIEVISTVKEHVEELEETVYKPEKFIRLVSHRETDSFAAIMSEIMAETEKMAQKVYPQLDSMSNIQNRIFGTQKYEQWIIETQKKCRVLSMQDKEEEMRICRALFTYTEHLRKYNDALLINDDARTKDALDYLEKFFNNVKNGSFNKIEQELAQNFQEKLPMLLKISNNNVNPKLDELQFILGEAYHENPQTLTLLFVKTRALVSALKKWIEETPSLKFLKPEILIGRSKRNEDTGMTLPSQKGALKAFQTTGESKLMIATSVADEGIDIQACNLVLLYEYVGNVTKMIQVRGRGRAKGSKCFLVTSKREEAEREEINLIHEKLMNEAVTLLQKENKENFLKKIHSIQIEEKQMRYFKKLCERPKPTEGNKRMICARCKTYACNTDDIRVIQNSHHTLIDQSFKDRYVTKPHPKPRGFDGYKKLFKIFCKNPDCGEDWGISGIYLQCHDIPLIKIEKFVIENPDGTQDYFSKWVQVNFAMKNFSTEEMSMSLSANSK